MKIKTEENKGISSDKEEIKEMDVKDFKNFEIYENLKIVKIKYSEFSPEISAIVCGKESNNLVILSYAIKKGNEEFRKDIIEGIRKINPIAGTTYIEKDSRNNYNIFFYVDKDDLNTKRFRYFPKQNISDKVSVLFVYGEGDKYRMGDSVNNLTIKSISQEDLEKICNLYHNKVDQFTNLEIMIAQKMRGITHKLICDKEGIIFRRTQLRTIKNQDYEINYDEKILDVPILLNKIYVNQNQERYYEVEVGDDLVCLNKKDFLDFLENDRNYAFISGRRLRDYISRVFQEFKKTGNLNPDQMYPTAGVFLDKNDNLIVVHTENEKIKLYGMNAYQKRTIERMKKRGIDLNGELIKLYYDLVHYNTYPEKIRLVSSGHSLIANFFDVLRDDIDIFPDHHWITPNKSVGKTRLFKLLYAEPYGIELKSNDDINSPARFSENCTDTTSCMTIDDIDKLNKEVLNQMKTAGTTLKAKERMTKDMNAKIQDTYRTFSGTANSDIFLSGNENEAYRGRCLISREYTIIDPFEDLSNLDSIEEKMREGRLLGYSLLIEAIEFITKKFPEKYISSHQKLKKLIQSNKRKLRDYFKGKVWLDDSRRLTIYALLYTAWEMLGFIFKKRNLSSELLQNVLKYKENNLLQEIIEVYEDTLLKISVDDILNVLEFYEKEFKVKYRDSNDNPVLTTYFINEYDKWAKNHNYSGLNKLPNLADTISKIIRERIEPKTIYIKEVETGEKRNKHGIKFDIQAIKQRLGIADEKEEFAERISITKVSEDQEKIFDELTSNLYKIFEENKNKPLEEKGLFQILELRTEIDNDTIQKFINLQIEEKNLKRVKNKYLQLEGDGRGKEKGDV